MTARTALTPALASAFLLLASCSDKGSDTGSDLGNTAPVAEAGENIALAADATVELDGRASYDAEGDNLTYHWSFDRVPEGSELATLEMPFVRNDNGGASTSSFAPDAMGTFVIRLEVGDGKVRSSPDFVVVTAQEPESRPVAAAGTDREAEVGQTLQLDGSSSYDLQGRTLSFAWILVEAPEASAASELIDADSAAPSLEVDAKGIYVFNLVVDNGLAQSDSDAVVVTATSDDSAPVANAGEDATAEDCTNLQLSGMASADPDGDVLEYFWELQAKPATSASNNNSFSDRRVEAPTFWADVAGTYNFSLAVSDGTTWSTADALTLTVEERATNSPPSVTINPIPTVAAGQAECATSGYSYACDDCEDQTILLGDTVAVVDSDNDPFTSQWTLISGSASIENPTSLLTNLSLEDLTTSEPYYCSQNQVLLQLTVTDCTGGVTQANAAVTAECCGIPSTSSR